MCPQKDLYWILRAVLFIIVTNCNEPKGLSVGEWINKWWYIITMEYYPAVKTTT